MTTQARMGADLSIAGANAGMRGGRAGPDERRPMVDEVIRRAVASWDRNAVIDRVARVNTETVFTEHVGEPAFTALMRESISANISALLAFLSGELTDLADVGLESPVVFARMQAETAVSRTAMLQSFRTGGRVVWDAWSTHLAEFVTSHDVPSDLYADSLSKSTLRLLEWSDHVTRVADRGYSEREQALRRSGSQARTDLVKEILSGGDPPTLEEVFPTLRYDISANHLAVQVSLGETRDVFQNTCQRVVDALRAASGASGALAVRFTATDVTVWLSRPRAWERDAVRAVVTWLAGMQNASAVSEPGVGIEGFRSCYSDLESVARVRAVWPDPPRVLEYDTIRMEILLLPNPHAARRLVRDQLGPLAEDTGAMARLRETLLAWLVCGSRVGAAESLGVHEHSVRNRLRRAEELLPRALIEQRAELHAALRLARLRGILAEESTAPTAVNGS